MLGANKMGASGFAYGWRRCHFPGCSKVVGRNVMLSWVGVGDATAWDGSAGRAVAEGNGVDGRGEVGAIDVGVRRGAPQAEMIRGRIPRKI